MNGALSRALRSVADVTLRRPGPPGALLVAIAALTVLGSAAPVRAQSPNDGLNVPETIYQSLTAIQRSFSLPSKPPLTLFPKMREQLKDTPAFLRDSQVGFNVRSYYRDNVEVAPKGTTVNEAWAGGGASQVDFESGRLFDLISGGFALYTSFPIYAPYQYGNSQLLLPDQQGYAVVGQLYGQVHLDDATVFTAGRRVWETPYLNGHDNRMTPNTFYGYVLQSAIGTPEGGRPVARLGGGYIATMKPRDAVDFQSMAQAAGVNSTAGVAVAGGRLDWQQVSIGAIDYFSQDTMNIAYGEGSFGFPLPLGLRAILAMQYADQRSTGSNLLNNGEYWSTGQVGSRLQLGYETAILTVGFSAVNPGYAMQSPWSSNPIYTDAQILSYQRAGEQAIMAGASVMLAPIGLPGVSASVFFYNGATNAKAAGKPLVESEWDFMLEWRPTWMPVNGFSLRARYGFAQTWQEKSLTTTDEIRLVLNYNVKLY